LTWFGRTDPAGTNTGPQMSVDLDGRHEAVRPADAVAASCAIPVLARPVRIGRHRYIDGGVHSPTNADALADHDLDLVIVLSPMGHTSADTPRSPARRIAQRRLRREVRTLRNRGVEVQVISPDPTTVRMMGWNMLERDNSGGVMRTAFLGTSPQLDPDVSTLLRHPRTAAEVA